MEFKEIIIKGKKVLYSECEEGYTLTLLERGGPIICDKDFDKAVERFELGLDVCLAVSMLLKVDKMIKDGVSDEDIKEEMKKEM